MAVQTVFKRYELKYLITPEQKQIVLQAMQPHMKQNKYGHATIRNIYFDTDTYLLIRRSIDKPVYKEKLRIRSYSKAGPGSTVFVELKKKYKGIVYKRRVSLPEQEAMEWLCQTEQEGAGTQISNEIDYFLKYYASLRPAVFISYERDAYFGREDPELRITFDENILCRQEDMSLGADLYGTPILPEGKVLMEIKCARGMPLWLVGILSQQHIYKTSFSKYGTAYRTMIFPKMKQEVTAHD